MSLLYHLSLVTLRHNKTLSAGLKVIQHCELQFMCISSLKHFRNYARRRIYREELCNYQLRKQSSVEDSIINETGSNDKYHSEQPHISLFNEDVVCKNEPISLSCTSFESGISNKTGSNAQYHLEQPNRFFFKEDAGQEDEPISLSCVPINEMEQSVSENYNLPLSKNQDDEFKIYQKSGLDEIDLNNPDESSVIIDDIAPISPVSFNLASYVNQSESLQQLIKLGVDLSKVEEKPEAAKFLLNLDFERDMKKHIQFLHDAGVPADELGKLLTKIPLIFQVDLEHLAVRVNYLESKKFNREAISRIITASPYHLMLNTKFVDQRLGFFQNTFSLTGDEVRFLITKCPKLIPYDHQRFLQKLFVMEEEMGFSKAEMKRLLLKKPKVWMLGRKNLSKRFNIVHNEMGIPHEHILRFPGILLTREFKLEQRHKYLSSLGRAQYDPKKPGYISLEDIAITSDAHFSRECAKTSVLEFNQFLKTL